MKLYKTLLLTFVLIGTFLSSFHVHDNHHDHEDCQVCVLQHNIVDADLPVIYSVEKVALFFEEPAYATSLLTNTLCKDSHSRAPPHFS